MSSLALTSLLRSRVIIRPVQISHQSKSHLVWSYATSSKGLENDFKDAFDAVERASSKGLGNDVKDVFDSMERALRRIY